VLFTACGSQPPPADDLANEMIDTLEVDGVPVAQSVKDCMHAKVDEWQLSEEDATGFKDLNDVADKAAEGQERALQIMQDFQDSLASCN